MGPGAGSAGSRPRTSRTARSPPRPRPQACAVRCASAAPPAGASAPRARHLPTRPPAHRLPGRRTPRPDAPTHRASSHARPTPWGAEPVAGRAGPGAAAAHPRPPRCPAGRPRGRPGHRPRRAVRPAAAFVRAHRPAARQRHGHGDRGGNRVRIPQAVRDTAPQPLREALDAHDAARATSKDQAGGRQPPVKSYNWPPVTISELAREAAKNGKPQPAPTSQKRRIDLDRELVASALRGNNSKPPRLRS